MKEKFYLTTAIAYTSSTPHIGNVYESVLSDSIARYKRKMGFDVYFQTGTDEHGQKIENKANGNNITPQAHVDNISSQIKNIYKEMNISYDHFIRTTDDYHMEVVQRVFERLYKQGDIYKGYYEGSYCVDCESYFTEKDLVDGCCPDCGAKVIKSKEEAYFMKLAKYQDALVKHIKDNPSFIVPESRKNEMLNNFLSEPLPDLCVSRTSYKWGIPVTFDTKHVIYVWIDALLNYITGIGYQMDDSKNSELFKKYWPADVHIIGKDILRFHTIYWPIILMALDLPLPKQIFGHPWILFGHDKMSKSKGNVMYTSDLVNIFGVDRVRYYCLHEIPFANDGSITYELLTDKTNSDLANTFGNLVNRSLSMAKKYFDGHISYKGITQEFDKDLEAMCLDTVKAYKTCMDAFKISDAIECVMKLLRRANKYVDETLPWNLAKDPNKCDELMSVIFHLLETIRFSAVLLENAMPSTSEKIYKMLNTSATSYDSLNEFAFEKQFLITDIEVLFQRIDIKDVLPKIEETIVEDPNAIGIEDFDKIKLVVGKILSAEKHPKADKLLVFKVDIGSEVRQIVSGIAKFYNYQDLIGKKVIVVSNLKSIKLRGIESRGMLLCASDKEDTKLELLTSNLNPGDVVR